MHPLGQKGKKLTLTLSDKKDDRCQANGYHDRDI
jgi:hypothetical protein